MAHAKGEVEFRKLLSENSKVVAQILASFPDRVVPVADLRHALLFFNRLHRHAFTPGWSCFLACSNASAATSMLAAMPLAVEHVLWGLGLLNKRICQIAC